MFEILAKFFKFSGEEIVSAYKDILLASLKENNILKNISPNKNKINI